MSILETHTRIYELRAYYAAKYPGLESWYIRLMAQDAYDEECGL